MSTTADPRAAGLQVSVANEQSAQPVNERQLIDASTAVLRDSEFHSASVSLAVVDDAMLQHLNRQYLNHDWPTDVLSFVLTNEDSHLEGEVIISADMAAANAGELGTSAADEQLLYVIHGTLHLIGYDDQSPEDIERMRGAEVRYMKRFSTAHEGADAR